MVVVDDSSTATLTPSVKSPANFSYTASAFHNLTDLGIPSEVSDQLQPLFFIQMSFALLTNSGISNTVIGTVCTS